MKKAYPFRLLLLSSLVLLFIIVAPAKSQTENNLPANKEKAEQQQLLTLSQLEQMALAHNPTLAQAQAAITAAQGRKKQAGLYPNPTIGYEGTEFAFRDLNAKSEHFFFVEQSIITAGKLKKSRDIFEQEKIAAELESETQKMRVINAVRLLYYQALAADQIVAVRTELANIASEASTVSGQLYNVGQADQPDLIEAGIQAQQAKLDQEEAELDRERVWQLLAAVVGDPSLKPAALDGNLEKDIPLLNLEEATTMLLNQSPQLKRAQVEVERARAALRRAQAERIPDLFVRGAIGYSNEILEPAGGPTRLESNFQVGINLPIFNRNQGNIGAARAEVDIAEREVKRQELALRAQLAAVFRNYLVSLKKVERYRNDILPQAQKAYDLYLGGFKQMTASYPQVLIAKRTMYQLRSEYLNELAELWQNALQIRGLLLNGGLDSPAGIQPESGNNQRVGESIETMRNGQIKQGNSNRERH